MFQYHAVGLLAVILTGVFFLFLPLATPDLIVRALDTIKSVVGAGRPMAQARPAQNENAPRAQKIRW